jgi:CRP-like cAMP-binding protein
LAPSSTTLIGQGRPADFVLLIQRGWAMRYRDLANGRRQIMDFVLTGDFCDPCIVCAAVSDFSVAAIANLACYQFGRQQLLELVAREPRIGLALWWGAATQADRLRSHLAAVGRSTAYERVAQLLLELWERLKAVHCTADHRFTTPITQEMMADATGLSAIHVNRVLHRMVRDGLIEFEHRRLRSVAHAPLQLEPGPVLRGPGVRPARLR